MVVQLPTIHDLQRSWIGADRFFERFASMPTYEDTSYPRFNITKDTLDRLVTKLIIIFSMLAHQQQQGGGGKGGDDGHGEFCNSEKFLYQFELTGGELDEQIKLFLKAKGFHLIFFS